jgi:adenine phosphoribosyltransferase
MKMSDKDIVCLLIRRHHPGASRADLSMVLRSYNDIQRVLAKLVDPFREDSVTLVAGIETSGIVFACSVALSLKVGVVIIRKKGREKSGNVISEDFTPNYKRGGCGLEVLEGVIATGDRVLIVDDFLEDGEQLATAIRLIERSGAEVVGASVFQANRTMQGERKFPGMKIHDFYHEENVEV